MGCDIHPAIQWISWKETDGAEHWTSATDELNWNRDYDLFARIAGVRRDEPSPIVPPRGWPTPKPYCFDFDDGRPNSDLHTPTWLTFEELATVGCEFDNVDVHAAIAFMRVYEQRGHRTRIVFAFDS